MSPPDEDIAELFQARDAQALWPLLVTRSGREMPPSVALDLFERHHAAGAPGAGETALLLGTDWRWRRTSAKVLSGILATSMLDDAEQDELARRLLWPPRVDYVHPTGWLGSTFLEFDIGPRGSGRRLPTRRVHIDPATPMHATRHIWPPLRRWAAIRLLARHRATPEEVLRMAESLPGQDRNAVLAGAVDAADHLPSAQARQVLDAALARGNKPARKAALERLCSWGETGRAFELAAADPDASIRTWAVARPEPSQPALF